MAVKYIPDGVHTITPYLTVSDTAAVLDFILRGLDNVTRIHEMKGTDGKRWTIGFMDEKGYPNGQHHHRCQDGRGRRQETPL